MTDVLARPDGRRLPAWVPFDEGEALEGQWYAGESPDGFSTKPIAERCPLCGGGLELVSARLFGRIIRDTEKRNPKGDQALVDVELMPASHEALSCSGCAQVFTRLKDGSQDSALSQEPA